MRVCVASVADGGTENAVNWRNVLHKYMIIHTAYSSRQQVHVGIPIHTVFYSYFVLVLLVVCNPTVAAVLHKYELELE